MAHSTRFDSHEGLRECHVTHAEGYRASMTDFHEHEYYEISLILSGNVRVLLHDRVQEGTASRAVLTPPHSPHLMTLREHSFYSRTNLIFTDDFLADYLPEWPRLRALFGAHGNVILLSDEQVDLCNDLLCRIKEEGDGFRRRLLIFLLLSHLSEHAVSEDVRPIAPYVLRAMEYIAAHYAKKFTAEELAESVGVGRTTLFTAFRAATGITPGEYTLRCRVRHATRLLREGLAEETVAELTGFVAPCNLIRAFKHCHGMTPKAYITQGGR